MYDKQTQVAILLMDLEAVLRSLSCWDAEPPTLEALQSQEPFCVDAMEFYQWLQWIFIPRISGAISSCRPLPDRCSIAPMGEEWLRARAFPARDLLNVLEKIDTVLSSS